MKITRCKLTGHWMASHTTGSGAELICHAPNLAQAMARMFDMVSLCGRKVAA